MKVPNVCPRCWTNWIPNNEHPGKYPGALSRADNKTEICSDCGTQEAMIEMRGKKCLPVESWPVTV